MNKGEVNLTTCDPVMMGCQGVVQDVFCELERKLADRNKAVSSGRNASHSEMCFTSKRIRRYLERVVRSLQLFKDDVALSVSGSYQGQCPSGYRFVSEER